MGFGEQIGTRSDAIRTLVVPSGWAFSIWGLLFLGCAIFAIWQALPAQRRNVLVDRIGWYAAGATAGNGLWATYTQFNNLTIVSALIILSSLACLLVILRELVAYAEPLATGERWIAALTFSSLAAWLTAASIVNISASLKYHGVGGAEEYPLIAAAILMVGGLIASLAVGRSKGNPWYAITFLWALLAIYFKGGQLHSEIAVATGFSAVLIVSAAAAQLRFASNRQRWLGW
ncbi:tryptophan-rich sensory protein [Pontixanthobacter gangjinensis]